MRFRAWSSFLVALCWTCNAALSHLPLVPQASSMVSAECQTLTQQCSEELGLFATSQSSTTTTPSTLEPVCGSDGRTYSSRCELQRARCNGHQIRVKYRGACRGEEKRCKQERRLAQRTARRQNDTAHGGGGKKANHNGETFIPECTEDGSFAEIQCHRATGYCWCVTPDGKPIPGSSILNSKPNCKRQSKPTPRRRSPQGKKPRKGCTPEDKAAFNGHLIRMFTTEFNRLPTTPMPSPAFAQLEGVTETVERRVIDWKFDVFDKNGDGLLNRPEYRVLRQLVQKVVRPKRCAKNFPRHCDTDEDRKISRSEWSVCLGIGVNRGDSSAEDSAGIDSGMSFPSDFERFVHSKHVSLPALQETSSLEETDPAEANDCYSERQAALEEVKHGTQDMYVPECTPDNKYQRVQCHAGYCWCASDETGRLIPGTSVHNSKPTNCDNLPAHLLNRSTTPRPTYRPLLAEEACPGRRKAQLQEDLVKFLRENLNDYLINITNTNPNRIVEPDYSLPIKERVAKWHLQQLDANKNHVIDRQETKSLRLLLKRSPKLRRCSKKIPAFCDINGDKRITADEWLQCLGVAKSNRHNVASPTIPPSGSVKGKRRGPNPLSTFLKENR